MSDRGRPNSRACIAEAAVAWFLRMREAAAPAGEREGFAEWLLDSPVHVHEYLAVARLYSDLRGIDPARKIATNAPASAVAAGSSVTVLPSAAMAGTEAVKGRAVRRRPVWYLAAAGFAALAVAASLLFRGEGDPSSQRYLTGIGEQRSIALADGSLIKLNTRSELIVAMNQQRRGVRLVRGEAFFEVHKDPARPFVVDTGNALVRALGTKFNVYKQTDATAVTVVDGEVAVTGVGSGADSAAPRKKSAGNLAEVHLAVGEQLKITARGRPEQKLVTNVNSVTAWQDRRLLFEGQTLDEIVAEFNRYNVNRIEIADRDLAKLELSGTFASNDPNSLIEFLKRVRSIRVMTLPDGTRVIRE